MEDWKDAAGIVHRGLIDKEYSAEYVKKYPNAVDKVHLMSPSAYKSEMYESLIELVNQDKVKFTAAYDNKGYLTVFDINEKQLASEKEKIRTIFYSDFSEGKSFRMEDFAIGRRC